MPRVLRSPSFWIAVMSMVLALGFLGTPRHLGPR